MFVLLMRYLKGYLRICVTSTSPERFLNLCRNRGILLWGLSPHGRDYEMYISIRGFRKLKPVLKKTKTKVTIEERFGLPFFFHKYRKRKMFFCGAAGCVMIVYLLSLFIRREQMRRFLLFWKKKIRYTGCFEKMWTVSRS